MPRYGSASRSRSCAGGRFPPASTGGITALAALSNAGLAAVDLANRLEQRLHDAIATAHAKGGVELGQVFDECQNVVCARAMVVKLATPSTFGVAKLTGFALHDTTVYQGRSPSGRS